MIMEVDEQPTCIYDMPLEHIDAVLESSISDLSLDPRTLGMLDSRGVHQVRDLLGYTVDDLLAINGFGKKIVNNILRALWDAGIHKPDAPRP